MTRLFKVATSGAIIAMGIAAATAGLAQEGHVPSPQSPSTMPGMQQGDMMKMMPQMSQMMSGCMQMMKSHMQQPADPSPKANPEPKG
jgi:hypothetical protein